MIKELTIKDVVFLAILSAVLILVSGLIMPIVMFTNIFALRQLLSAPIFALFCAVGLTKVPKIGAFTIIGVITGGVLLFMSPIMFFNQVIAAVIIDLAVWVIAKNYKSKRTVWISAGLYTPITLPVTLVATSVMRGMSLSEQMGNPWLTVFIVAATVALGLGGSLVGQRIAAELRKAGKI